LWFAEAIRRKRFLHRDGGGERRLRSWLSCRTNRHGRRNFSHARPAFLSLGAHSTSRRRLGTVYLGELDCRPGWLLHKSPHHSFARLHFGSGSNYRRHHRLAFGKQALCCAHNFALPGDSAGHCGNKIDLHDIAPMSDGFPAVTFRDRRLPKLSLLEEGWRTAPLMKIFLSNDQ
jgi:hypothetical protein